MRVLSVPDHPVSGPAPRHLRAAQEGPGLPPARLCRGVRPIDFRRAARGGRRRGRRQDAGAGRRRPVLQRRGGADHPAPDGRQRRRPGAGRARRAAVDAGGQRDHPRPRRVRRHRPVGEPQSGRSRRRFRHQVQCRQWRAGAGAGDRGDLPPHAADRAVPHGRGARLAARPHRHGAARATWLSRSSIRSPITPR